jgi:hypothetical protein
MHTANSTARQYVSAVYRLRTSTAVRCNSVTEHAIVMSECVVLPAAVGVTPRKLIVHVLHTAAVHLRTLCVMMYLLLQSCSRSAAD